MTPAEGTDRPSHTVDVAITADDVDRRLDLVLTAHLPTLSRSQIQRLIRSGQVLVNGRRPKAGAALRPGSTISVTIPASEPAEPEAEDLPLAIVHDDNDLTVVNKPAGMVVHPAAGHRRGTLVNALLHHVKGLSGIGGQERPGIVHRLDKGTSGLMVIAKNDRAHRDLARQFHDRTVTKEYVAFVWGKPSSGTVIEQAIGRDPRHRAKMSSRAPRGRAAVTRIVSAEFLSGVSLVRLAISTGRTHQIRVHLSERGYPVVGDELYGGVRKQLPAHLRMFAAVERPLLHAARLSFAHPIGGRTLSFTAPLPSDMADLLAALGSSERIQ